MYMDNAIYELDEKKAFFRTINGRLSSDVPNIIKLRDRTRRISPGYLVRELQTKIDKLRDLHVAVNDSLIRRSTKIDFKYDDFVDLKGLKDLAEEIAESDTEPWEVRVQISHALLHVYVDVVGLIYFTLEENPTWKSMFKGE